MIEFKTHYTEKFINNTPERNFHYDLINQYGPWVANVSNKDDVNLIIAAPKMAEYMMARARKIASDLKCDMYLLSPYDKRISVLNNELEEILSILKGAGVEVVEK